jgi:hypothetical protein
MTDDTKYAQEVRGPLRSIKSILKMYGRILGYSIGIRSKLGNIANIFRRR